MTRLIETDLPSAARRQAAGKSAVRPPEVEPRKFDLPAELYAGGVECAVLDDATLVVLCENLSDHLTLWLRAPDYVVSKSHPIEEVAAAIAASGSRVTICLAQAENLTVGRVKAVQEAFDHHNIQTGFLSGRTPELLRLSLDKLMAQPQKPERLTDVFDAVSFELNDAEADVAALRSRLKAANQTKIIRSHGEGSHAKLPGLTICGLLDDNEFPDAPKEGCSFTQRCCKRQPKLPGARVLFGRELQAQTVFFLCCNGFNIAGELYPTPVSIAQSLTEGAVANLVTPYRAVVVPDAVLEWLAVRVAQGGRLGDIVSALNDKYVLLSQGRPFVLHGNPDAVLSRDTSLARDAVAAPSKLLSSKALAEECDQCRRWLARLLANANRAECIVDSISRATDQVPVEVLSKGLKGIRKLGVFGLKRAQRSCFDYDLRELDKTIKLLKMLILRADANLTKTIVSARRFVDPFDLFHYDQLLEDRAKAGPCDRCGTALVHECFGDTDNPGNTRQGVFCDVCGPKAETRHSAMQIQFAANRVPQQAQIKEILHTRLSLDFPTVPLVDFACVSARFFDKAIDLCVLDVDTVVDATLGLWEHYSPLEQQLSSDLHSMRVVVSCGLELGYARCRVPGGSIFASNAQTEAL